MLAPATQTTEKLPGDDLIAAAVAAALAEPNYFGDDFGHIWRVAARKQDNGVCAASCICKIEGIAERIERKTGDHLARVVIILCNTQRCPDDQMLDIAAAVAARAALVREAA
jgi:hypothetical protein